MGNVLQCSVRSLGRSKRPDEVEPLVELVIRQNAGDWRVLVLGALIHAELERSEGNIQTRGFVWSHST